MITTIKEEYVLTIVQHTYCPDCMWMKGKITDVYHASGIVRGDDSRNWRVQIISPPWDRDARKGEFPSRFDSVDVPAMKLEAGNRLVLTTQRPTLINDLLVKLKWLLINRKSNAEIETELKEFVRTWQEQPGSDTCVASM
jgi:hypothetical protein